MTVTQCKNACSAMVSDLNGCTGLDCLCTNENGKQLKQCVDCLVKVTPSDTTTANGQATLDGKCLSTIWAPNRDDADAAHLGFVAGCKAGGKSINSLTLGGSSNSNSNSNSSFGSSNGARGSTLHLVANSGALAVALVGVVAYLF